MALPQTRYDRFYSGVLLISPDGSCVLQRRDRKAGIKNPGLITTFGGARNPGETAAECAIRELAEKLCLSIEEKGLSLVLETEITTDGLLIHCTIFMVTHIDLAGLTLREGEKIEVLTIEECTVSNELSPLCRQIIHAYKTRQSGRSA